MAQEAIYGAGGESKKRRYNESPPPMTRRITGFSSAPDIGAPSSSYNSIPPPLNEIDLAKQKAQKIAARFLNDLDPSKKARVENGADVGGGYYAYGSARGPQLPKKIEIPNGSLGLFIDKGKDIMEYIEIESGAIVKLSDSGKTVEIYGAYYQLAIVEEMLNDVFAEAETGSDAMVHRWLTEPVPGAKRFSMMVPNNKVGLGIGKGGETIKSIQAETGARIKVIIQIDGTSEEIEAAKLSIEEVTSEKGMRNPSMGGGGYNTLQVYQSRPPTNPMQQQPNYRSIAPQTHTQKVGGGYDYDNTPPRQQQPQTQGGSTDNKSQAYGHQTTGYNQPQGYNNAGGKKKNPDDPPISYGYGTQPVSGYGNQKVGGYVHPQKSLCSQGSGSGLKHSGLRLGGLPQSVGSIIGKVEGIIEYFEMETGTNIQVYNSGRTVEISGSRYQLAKAEQFIKDVISEAEAGRSANIHRWLTVLLAGAEQFSMIPLD